MVLIAEFHCISSLLFVREVHAGRILGSAKQRFYTHCTDVQADLCLCWLHKSKLDISWHNQSAVDSNSVVHFLFFDPLVSLYQILTLVLLNQDSHWLWKLCRSRSDGFFRSHLIRIYRGVCCFTIQFVNLYKQTTLSYLIGWQSEWVWQT